MKINRISASFLAIGLLAAPLSLAGVLAGPAFAEAAASAEVATILADARAPSALTDKELRLRLKAIRNAIEGGTLDPATVGNLRKIAKAARQELQSRAGAADANAGQDNTTAPADTVAAAPTTDTQAPDDIAQFLADQRPLAGLATADLKSRFDAARGFLQRPQLSVETRKALQVEARKARTELAARQASAEQTANQNNQQTGGQDNQQTDVQNNQQTASQDAQQPAPKGTTEATAFINNSDDAQTLNRQQLRLRILQGQALMKDKMVSDEQRKLIHLKVKGYRDALDVVKAQAGGTGTGTGTGSGGTGGPAADPGSEARAQALLNDPTKPQDMPNPKLRQRLSDIRALLAANQLTPQTELALRRMLQADRQVLRGRLTAQEGGNGGTGNSGGGQQNAGNGNHNNTINITIVLGDRRPPERLRDDELRTRLDVYREAVLDQRYNQADRDTWKSIMVRDRMVLRQRLIAARQARSKSLNNNDFNVELGMNFEPNRKPQRDVFAAEADDSQLEDTLAAPPRVAVKRRYTVAEVESDPSLRDAVSRIEIDTVHFGFGESYVREEEVENLDRIAEIMEKILAEHPGEVFVIEGHTDAVGSDEANLRLSKLRAEAIKQALATFYVIPLENLETVGYGERYLKIPTADAEAENRRVSVARITPLVGARDN